MPDNKETKDKTKSAASSKETLPGLSPDEIGAGAYSGGSDIHIADGGGSDIPHEGMHTLQQKPKDETPGLAQG